MTEPLIQSRALDVLVIAPEIFIKTAQETLKMATGGELGEVPLLFGRTVETMRPVGTIYVIPQSKRRSAFPLLWDTERFKHQYPYLFQSLKGPEWPNAFTTTADANGTIHLQDGLMSDVGSDITELPEYIDSYLEERCPDKGTMLLYRPLFSSADRVRTVTLSEKGDKLDEGVTKFLRELYGFFPSTNANPLQAVTLATEGVPEGYGVPVTKTSSTASASGWRYVAAPSAKEAKKKTRFYTSYATAKKFGEDSSSVFRFKLVDSSPDWKTIKEMHSEAEDSVTSKTAFLSGFEKLEFLKMASRFKHALEGNTSRNTPNEFVDAEHAAGSTCEYCGDPAEGLFKSSYDPSDPSDGYSQNMCKDCWGGLNAPVSEKEYEDWLRGSLTSTMGDELDAGLRSDPTPVD